MSRLGLFCFLGRGHLDPCLALARTLQGRGHQVTVFHLTIAQAAITTAGLGFYPLDAHERVNDGASGGAARRPWARTVAAVATHARRVLDEAPAALLRTGVEAVIADQLDVAAGTVAAKVGLPFVSVSCGPPVYLDDSTPPSYFGAAATATRQVNCRANALFERIARPVLSLLNARRAEWKLGPLRQVNDLFSPRAIVTQLPEILELPRVKPPHLFYTGPFKDDVGEKNVGFDLGRLDGRPLIYASMGTIRNDVPDVFRMIADACAHRDAQLVLSLGGGPVRGRDLGPLPGSPIVATYVRQRELLRRAILTINCAGLNTSLDSLACGVPIVAIPVAEDQPGVAARIARAGVGVVVPFAMRSAARLRDAVDRVLDEPAYTGAARRVQGELTCLHGAVRAAELIERSFAGRFVSEPVGEASGR
jgi:MGT family glycosyltransferase